MVEANSLKEGAFNLAPGYGARLTRWSNRRGVDRGKEPDRAIDICEVRPVARKLALQIGNVARAR